jgi:hypothetical protein
VTTLRDIADGLRDRVLTVPGLAVFETPPQSASPPMVVVWPPTVDYHETFGSNTARLIRTTVDVWILTGPAGAFTDVSVRDLWEFADTAGDRSIHAALSGDPTLGGVAETCHVASFRPAGVEEVAGIGFVGGVFAVEVHWRAS